LSKLFYVADLDYSWLAKFLSLLLLPLAHEDLAILLGGYLVVNQLMPVGFVVIGIYFGMVASDMSLYCIGAGARHIPWLNRLAVNERVTGFGDKLDRNLLGLTALSRVVPGVVFVVMIACGYTRVSFSRFTLASLITSALYLPLVLYLVVLFGDALDDRVGLWTWPFLLGVLTAAAFIRYRVFTFREKAPSAAAAQAPLRSRPRAETARPRPVLSQIVNSPAFPRAARWMRLR
jgi:membrane protein DedA with SNARE-associated domain